MKPWNAWFASLGMAGLCMTWVGCGGSSPSDTSSNEANPAPIAESESTPAEGAVAEPAPTVAAPDSTEPAPAVAAQGSSEGAATSESTPANSAPADTNRSDGPSATAAMLAAANTPAPAPAEPAPAGTAVGAIPAGEGAALAAATPAVAAPAAMPAPAPEPAPPAAPGDAPARGKKADFHTHFGAVTAFLDALKAKDPVLLREATALRAPTEAKPKNQPLFTAILEQSLTEDEITELASKLEGFTIVDANAAKSSGRYSYILAKPGKNGSTFRRTITARHEKKGWKVVDISGQGEIEKPLLMPRMGRGGGGRR